MGRVKGFFCYHNGFLWTQHFNIHTQTERASSFFAGKPCDLFIHLFICFPLSLFILFLGMILILFARETEFCNFVRREMNVFLTFLGNLFIPWNSQTGFLFLFSFKFPSLFVTFIWKTWSIHIIPISICMIIPFETLFRILLALSPTSFSFSTIC